MPTMLRTYEIDCSDCHGTGDVGRYHTRCRACDGLGSWLEEHPVCGRCGGRCGGEVMSDDGTDLCRDCDDELCREGGESEAA